MTKKILLSLGVITAATLPVITAAASASDGITQTKILYDGMIFNSKDNVVSYMFDKGFINTDKTNVIGDIGNSYSNFDLGTLNKGRLPEFSPETTSFAWGKADGSLTSDYDKAKSTFFNEGLSNMKYSDGFGGYFLSSDDAHNSALSKQQIASTPFVKAPYVHYSNGHLDTNIVDVNPFYKDDTDKIYENLQANFYHIIDENMNKNISGTDGYSVHLEETSTNKMVSSSSFTKNKFQNIKPNSSTYYNLTGMRLDSDYSDGDEVAVDSIMSAPKVKIGTQDWNDVADMRMTFNANGTSLAEDFDSSTFQLSTPHANRVVELKKFNITGGFEDVKKFLKNPSTYLKINGKGEDNINVNVISEFTKTTPFDDILKPNSNSTISKSKVENYFNNNYFNGITSVLTQSTLDSYFDFKVNTDVKYTVNFTANGANGSRSYTGNGYTFNKKNYVKINTFGDIEYKVNIPEELSILSVSNNASESSKLVKQLSNTEYGKNYKFVISYNNEKLFETKSKGSELQGYSQNDSDKNLFSLENKLKKITGDDYSKLWTNDLTKPIAEAGKFSIPNHKDNYSFDDVFWIYWWNLANILKPELSGNSGESIFNNIKYDKNALLHYQQNNPYKISFQVLRSASNYNSTIYDSYSHLNHITTQSDATVVASTEVPDPVAKYIFYDINGNVIDYNENVFDTFELMKVNITNKISPRKSSNYVFIDGSDIPISNTIHSIYKLDFFGNELYFAEYSKMLIYIFDIIESVIKYL